MIVLTVKTLDSQNHIFSVDDDITVEQFKTKIANTVNIPPDTQRIIYCGRVLQDSSKLSDYDVNGKVVHLVQRPPPAQNPPTTRSSSPPPPRRGFRGFETGNTMYLGSMAFPSNLMESQGIVPPPPTHSLAGSRLNVARRMLRRAEAVITLLENPTARPSEQANTEEQPEEEVTPIIEARVIVPRGNNDTIDEAMVLSAVQNTLFDAASGALPMGAEVTIDASGSSSESPPASAASTPEEAATASGESAGANQQRPAGVSARTLAENASRTSEMAELLSTLNQLQVRFAPFLERYRQFMVDDPIIPQENMRQTQAMLGRVSEVLHFLGHAYHSLSDIIIRVRTPPPRPLLCRPILIQHSAVVQAGIPIQVEAQFNLSTERPNASTTSNTATTNTETVTTTANTASNQSTTAQTPTTSSRPTQPTINFRGFPILPGASMHIQALRAGGRPVNLNASPRPQNNNNNTMGGSPNTASTTSASTTTSTTTPGGGANFVLPNLNNSSVEFFMEVTPEVLQGGMNGPPPEFLQSLVQMAGQIMNRVASSNGGSPSTTSTSTTAASSESSAASSAADSSQSNVPSAPTASGQNSQARGNTQTHPTTATHTRSTPRPHVHLAQQAMQGGFDPFLPCNSHHVIHRRRHQSAARLQQQSQSAQQQSSSQQGAQSNRERPQERASGSERGEEDTSQNIHNLFDEIYNSLRLAYRRNRGWDSTNRTQAAQPATPAQQQTPPDLQNIHAFIADFSTTQSIARLLQQTPGDDEAPSGSNPPGTLINDLIYMLSRTLTLGDMVTLSTANYEPLVRIRDDIREFIITRLVDGPMAPDTINLGVNTLLTELGPFFQHFARLNVRDNVDIVRSLESLFRDRLPEIFACAIQLTSDEWVPHLVELCVSLVKAMFALALNVSANGQQGVEETLTHIISAYMQGVPDDLREWTTNTSRENLRQFLNGISGNDSSIESFVVRQNQDVAMETASGEAASQEPKPSGHESEQPMELDEPAASAVSAGNAEGASAAGSLNLSDDQEALPAVVVGSEQWHGDVPDDWVPIITRDVNRQRRQNPQAPFSDAYLSGMPTKRRKIVNSTKPQGSLPQVIADSVRRAVTATGLSSAAPVEAVAQAAGDSSEVQTAYRNLLRTTVQTALRDNEDFTPERFPNASTYFKPQ